MSELTIAGCDAVEGECFVECPKCKSRVKQRNLSRHLRKIHRNEVAIDALNRRADDKNLLKPESNPSSRQTLCNPPRDQTPVKGFSICPACKVHVRSTQLKAHKCTVVRGKPCHAKSSKLNRDMTPEKGGKELDIRATGSQTPLLCGRTANPSPPLPGLVSHGVQTAVTSNTETHAQQKEIINCPKCSSKVRADRLARHLSKMHGQNHKIEGSQSQNGSSTGNFSNQAQPIHARQHVTSSISGGSCTCSNCRSLVRHDEEKAIERTRKSEAAAAKRMVTPWRSELPIGRCGQWSGGAWFVNTGRTRKK